MPDHLELIGESRNHALLVDTAGLSLNLVVTGDEYDRLLVSDSTAHFQRLSRWLFAGLEDAFDWVIVTFDPARPREATPVGRFHRAKSDVGGFGYPLLPAAPEWGAGPRLGGLIMLQRPGNLRSGPSLHEFLHQWGQTLIDSSGWSRHWGLSGVGGQLGGWVPGTLEELGGGLYRGYGPTGRPFGPIANYGNRVPYADWELYMMGVLPPDSLGPIEVAVEGESVDPLGVSGTFRAAGIVVRSPPEILSRFRPRDPAWPDAPSGFRAALVILSTEPLERDVVRAIGEDVVRFTRHGDDDDAEFFNFWEATGGRATLRMDGLKETVRD